MSERDASADGLCSDAAPDYIPPRASRGRRSGVIGPAGGQDPDTFLLESVKAAPRRSSIIKVKSSTNDSKMFLVQSVVGRKGGIRPRFHREQRGL